MTGIGDGAFSGCGGLKYVYVNWGSPLDIYVSTFEGIDKKASILYVPQGTRIKYKSSNWGEAFDNIVEYAVTGIDQLKKGGDTKELSRYSVNGQPLAGASKGLNIVKYNDGSVKKVVVQ